MGFLLEKLTKQSLDNQIEVVRNERRQNYDNRPYGKALFALYAALYPEGHPYRYLTIGRHEDLATASVDDVKAFFKTWYVPANATLTLVGDVEIPRAKELVQKWFGSFPKSDKPAVVSVPPHAVWPTVTFSYGSARNVSTWSYAMNITTAHTQTAAIEINNRFRSSVRCSTSVICPNSVAASSFAMSAARLGLR